MLHVTNMWPDDDRPFYGSFVRSQVESLAEAGLGIDVIYVRGYKSARAYAAAVPTVARIARSGAYDLVHVHYGHTVASSQGIRGLPSVYSFCGEDLLGAPRTDGITRKSRVEVALFRQLARRATSTITKSQEMERILPASVQRRNHVVPNGVDLDRFQPRSREDARSRVGWPQDKRIVLFLGNPDDPRKNVALARAAHALVDADDPGSVLLHEAWKVPVEEVPALMNAADCLVFPSNSEGSPNAIKEAMASALPIVASPVGDIPERTAGVAGCFVRSPEPEQFAAALREALHLDRAPEARAAMQEISIGAIAERLIGIYRQTISAHSEKTA